MRGRGGWIGPNLRSAGQGIVLLVAILGLLGLNACGGAETPGSGPERAENARAAASDAEEPPIRRNGLLAGRLLVEPASLTAGETLWIAVENVGELTMFYGLGNQVERRVEGDWRDATADVYPTNHAVRGILLQARPGERAGPDYGTVADRILLPSDLQPGRYRVLKLVSGNDRGFGPPKVMLEAAFDVRPPTAEDDSE